MFVIGGNGSGKTTLAKLLTGLYVPESGEIRLDGEPITADNREGYRQLFSVVFDDAVVFDSLWGLDGADLDQRAGEYLAPARTGSRGHGDQRRRSPRPRCRGASASGWPC